VFLEKRDPKGDLPPVPAIFPDMASRVRIGRPLDLAAVHAASVGSSNVGSSSPTPALLTRFETGH
jgi:hypothetical protein